MTKNHHLGVLLLMLAAVPASNAGAESWFEIKAAHSEKCLGVRNDGKENYEKIEQQTCKKSANQLWRWEKQQLKNKSSSKCLDVTDRSHKNAVHLQQYSCRNQPNQTFGYSHQNHLVAQHSGKCLDVAGAITSDGGALQQNKCIANGKNQQFTLAPAESFEGEDKFWTRKSKVAGRSIHIYASSHTSWSAVEKVKGTIELLISDLKEGYDRKKLDDYNVYVTNGEDWSVLTSVAPIGSFFRGGTEFNLPAADFFRGGAGDNDMWVTEQMICRNGVATRDRAVAEGRSKENDRHDRIVDQIVHEFSHTFQRRFDLDKNKVYLDAFTTNAEVFPWNVQNYYEVPLREIPANRKKFIDSMFTGKSSFSCDGYTPPRGLAGSYHPISTATGYQGCYSDYLKTKAGERAKTSQLNGERQGNLVFESRLMEFKNNNDKMEPDVCIADCKNDGYKYAAVQHTNECWCSNEMPMSQKIDDTHCNTECSGNDELLCGGWHANGVYKLN